MNKEIDKLQSEDAFAHEGPVGRHILLNLVNILSEAKAREEREKRSILSQPYLLLRGSFWLSLYIIVGLPEDYMSWLRGALSRTRNKSISCPEDISSK